MNEQQNLIADLKAPIKSFRIFALEEVIRTGASQEVLAVLEEIRLTEDDGECSMLISHAISSVKSRLSGSQASPGPVISHKEEFLAAWNGAEEQERLKILSDLPARLPKELKELGPELITGEKSSVIVARIIRVFCRSWPEEKFALIVSYLNSKSLSLQLASLRTIVHMRPELLINDLPQLLNSKDPQIKALAIRGLAKIDKEEALNHLQALLLSSDQSDRMAGIQNCPFLPFEMVKPVLLKYFAAENDPELLVRAGWIFEMNPDIQVPFKLFEIVERSPARKAELAKKILNECVRLLDKSGVLGGQFAAYTKKLQAWVSKRNALRFVRQAAGMLDAEKIDAELDLRLRNGLKQPVVVEAFKEALEWPISETVKSRIKAYVKSVAAAEQSNTEKDAAAATDISPAPAVGAGKSPSAGSDSLLSAFSEADDQKKISILTGLDQPSAVTLLKEIQKLVAAKDASGEVKIAAFHCLGSLRARGLEDSAVKLISHQNASLATAAVEYLGEVDPDAVFPYLGQCLKVADVRMKSAALGILKNFDFNQALSSLNAMLRSPDSEQQMMAIQCMEHFDFALIREHLTDYLCRCGHENLAEAGLCYFAANPASENVYSLYKIEKAHSGHIAAQARQLRESCRAVSDQDAALAAPPGKESAGDSEEALKERWQAEQQKRKARKPAYAYRSPADEIKLSPRQTVEALFLSLKELLSAKSSWVALGILLLFAAGFYVLFVPKDTEAGNTAGGAIVVDQYVREGTVRLVVNAAVEFESLQGEKFVLTPAREGYRMPSVGAKLRVSLVPFRRGPDNSYLARIRSMREITAFSEGAGKDVR